MASVAYLLWAGLGKLLTGHAGLFFIDAELMGDVKGATVAAGMVFVLLSKGGKLDAATLLSYLSWTNRLPVFAFMYGLVAMRETLSAHNHH